MLDSFVSFIKDVYTGALGVFQMFLMYRNVHQLDW